MFRLFRSLSDSQCIDRGLVHCPPRAADVELDVCAGCEWMREIDEKAKIPFVRCRPKMSPLIVDVQYRHGHMLY